MAEPRADLIWRAQAGDGRAIGSLIEGQQTYVYSIALTVMKEPADAADATQEAFIRLMRSIGTYRGDTKFTTWLYRLTTNICLDALRRRGRGAISLDAPIDDDGGTSADFLVDSDRWSQPESHLDLQASRNAVRDAIADLAEAQRLALTLHYFEDMRYEDIADVMGVPINTVKSHIHRGKAKLTERLRAFEEAL